MERRRARPGPGPGPGKTGAKLISRKKGKNLSLCCFRLVLDFECPERRDGLYNPEEFGGSVEQQETSWETEAECFLHCTVLQVVCW